MATPKRNTAAALTRLNEGITPHAKTLAEIGLAGDVAIVVFNLAADDERIQAAARAAGWDGRTAAFAMDNAYRKRLAENSDAVTAAWLRRVAVRGEDDVPNSWRILVFTESATLLVNFTPGRGFSFEPGSLDSQRV